MPGETIPKGRQVELEYISLPAILRTCRGWMTNTPLPMKVGQCNVAEQCEQGLRSTLDDPSLAPHTFPFLLVPRACFTQD